ncbi:MAG: DUF4293 domain-containing protein [Cytophagales bacterium]|nr:DUF4293 domain-containing protein [Cytophagales bacterium]MDW8383518.1 DUF4293 domain-containing protein [Flammeovirgaceae bacterium]
MIQRVQTIFMFLAAVSMFSLLFVKIWGKTDLKANQVAELNAYTLTYQQGDELKFSKNVFYISVLAFLSSSLSVGAIVSYKNLMRQIQLNLINILLILVIMGITLYQVFYVGEKLFNPEKQGGYGIGFFLPLAAIFFINFANRYIRKDYELLKSVDRLR